MQRTLLSVSVEPSLKAITINLKEHFKNPSSVPLVGRYQSKFRGGCRSVALKIPLEFRKPKVFKLPPLKN